MRFLIYRYPSNIVTLSPVAKKNDELNENPNLGNVINRVIGIKAKAPIKLTLNKVEL